MRNAHGTSPMIGPKNGITFVTPMTVAISAGYGIFRIRIPM